MVLINTATHRGRPAGGDMGSQAIAVASHLDYLAGKDRANTLWGPSQDDITYLQRENPADVLHTVKRAWRMGADDTE